MSLPANARAGHFAKLGYLARGAKFEEWKSDPFLALYTYIELLDGFGWDFYKRVFRAYSSIPKEQIPTERPGEKGPFPDHHQPMCGQEPQSLLSAMGHPGLAECPNCSFWPSALERV